MMTFDAVERSGLDISAVSIRGKLESLNKGFRSSLAPEGGVYASENTAYLEYAKAMGVENIEQSPTVKATIFDTIKGLKRIADRDVSNDYLRQQAGFAAEKISTGVDNIKAISEGTGEVTIRLDEMSDDLRSKTSDFLGDDWKLSKGNDPFADKFRLRFNEDGSIKDCKAIQSKFVGKNAKECYAHLKSSEYNRYYEKCHEVEIPKDYYEGVKQINSKKIKSIEESIKKLELEGNTEKIAEQQIELEKCKLIDAKTKPSSISYNTPYYTLKAIRAHKAGVSSAKQAAGLTAVVSGVDNFQQYYNGEISGTEAIENVAKDTAIAGGIGYVTGAVTDLAGGSNIPAAVITMGVESYDDVKGYVDGDISGEKLAYELGGNAARTAGGIAGFKAGAAAGALTGAKVGVVVGGVGGAATGAAVGGVVGGFAGSMGGSAVAAKAYEAGAEFVSDW
ncbi:hypothetical protein SAMN02910447_01559 [Ruminococcus sp. YE71]|uniref:hypothetical protein n=1 Tax=unclassified Ruminococcus TaxID=2608920 RepID=UPI0008879EE6|nr:MULTISPECIES: hypothetical protein [unclassified Ruminococcus]SDA18319.1 hypothetical protein SAMN02910446_01413 [Ruminococcus sp. YE78]SFW30114.1 hypothetical protein SAMN02910447_01559 [Ruminococcus sp. YE71]